MGAEFSQTELKKFKMNKKGKTDEFIIDYCQKTEDINTIKDVSSFDHRRLVFVSLIDLFRTWRKVPLIVLYSSIFILPIKEKWVRDPAKHYKDLKASSIIADCNLFNYDVAETKVFLKLLQWKLSQGLLFCMLNTYKQSKRGHKNVICPFWNHLSEKLTNLKDPISKQKYNPISMDMSWWNKDVGKFKYGVKVSSVLSELYFLTMKYQSIQEIIYQSNPTSLNPITAFTEGCIYNQHHVTQGDMNSVLEDKVMADSGFVVLSDYDPYDI